MCHLHHQNRSSHNGDNQTSYSCFFFFFNDTATTEIYTLSLHDALPIYIGIGEGADSSGSVQGYGFVGENSNHGRSASVDRKSTRLNSSHLVISYAVFCLKKKKNAGKECRIVEKTAQR